MKFRILVILAICILLLPVLAKSNNVIITWITTEPTSSYYQINSSTWHDIPPCPITVPNDGRAVVLDNSIYMSNGTVYDITGNTWDIFENVSVSNLLLVDNSIYLFGEGGIPSSDFQRFNTSGQTLETLAPLPDMTIATGPKMLDNGSIYVMTATSHRHFLYRYEINQDIWTLVSDYPAADYNLLSRLSSVMAGEKIFCLYNIYNNDFFSYDIACDSWISLAPPPCSNGNLFLNAGNIILISPNYGVLGYDTSSDSWYTIYNAGIGTADADVIQFAWQYAVIVSNYDLSGYRARIIDLSNRSYELVDIDDENGKKGATILLNSGKLFLIGISFQNAYGKRDKGRGGCNPFVHH